MGKFALHKNVKRKGSSANTVKNTTVKRRPNERLRPINEGDGDNEGEGEGEGEGNGVFIFFALLAIAYIISKIIQQWQT